MKICAHLWYYPAEFFLEWEMFQTKFVGTKHTLYLINLFRKSCHLLDIVEKYG
jgi:hypothetical protein